MTVQRKTIRCFFAEALKGKTAALDAVASQRSEAIRPQTEEAPVSLMVYTLTETVTRENDTPRIYRRELELAVEVFTEQAPELDADDLEDLVDDVTDQVECVIEPLIPQLLKVEVPGTGSMLDVNPSTSGLQRVEIAFDAQGRQLMGSARVVFLIVYYTDVDEREQARATDLAGARVAYKFPPPLGDGQTVVAEDEIETPGG